MTNFESGMKLLAQFLEGFHIEKIEFEGSRLKVSGYFIAPIEPKGDMREELGRAFDWADKY